MTIAQAVKENFEHRGYDTGALETASYTVDNTLEALGGLIELLYDKGILTKEDLKGFISRNLEEVEDDSL